MQHVTNESERVRSQHATNDGEYLRSQWTDRIRLPKVEAGVDQHEEWCEIHERGEWRRLRFHDYAEIYRRPGLYEHLFYGMLACRSPERVSALLTEVCEESGVAPPDLRVLDLGAGNGIVGQRLRERGVEHVLGIDILPEAAAAAERDRRGVYDDYVVADLLELRPEVEARLRAFRPT